MLFESKYRRNWFDVFSIEQNSFAQSIAFFQHKYRHFFVFIFKSFFTFFSFLRLTFFSCSISFVQLSISRIFVDDWFFVRISIHIKQQINNCDDRFNFNVAHFVENISYNVRNHLWFWIHFRWFNDIVNHFWRSFFAFFRNFFFLKCYAFSHEFATFRLCSFDDYFVQIVSDRHDYDENFHEMQFWSKLSFCDQINSKNVSRFQRKFFRCVVDASLKIEFLKKFFWHLLHRFCMKWLNNFVDFNLHEFQTSIQFDMTTIATFNIVWIK